MNPRALFLGVSFLSLIGFASGRAESAPDTTPVNGVEILVENVDNGNIAATRTGETGHFSLSGLAPGEYRLIIGIVRRSPIESESQAPSNAASEPAAGYDVRLSVYGGAMTAQWVPASSPKMRVGIVFAVPVRASGTIAGMIKPAAPPTVQTQTTWVVPRSLVYLASD